MTRLLVFLPMLVTWGCSAPQASERHADSKAKLIPATNTPSLPHLYWPLDHTKEQSQVTVPGLARYQAKVITTCLNDSAVVNPTTLDTGPALDVSHNYVSDLFIVKNGHVWQRQRLTKALFQGNAVAQTLGSLATLALSSTSFTSYKKPDFRFYTRLGVPDSDIFVEAEVALSPGKALRLISVHEQEPAEPE